MNSLDKNYENLFTILIPENEKAIAEGLAAVKPAPPLYFGNKTISPPTTKQELYDFFNPVDAWKTYTEYLDGGSAQLSTLNLKMAAKLQSDMLAQLKREYLMFTTSYVQACANECSARDKNSKAGGALINIYGQTIRNLNEVTSANQQ
jgi:hypothetical protein